MKRFKDFGIFPKSIIKITTTTTSQIRRNKHSSAQRAGSLTVTDPSIEASTVEDVTAVSETADLIVGLELVETNSAAVRWVEKVGKLDDGENLTEKGSGERIEMGEGRSGKGIGGIGPRNVGFEEILEAKETEDEGDKLTEKAEEGE